MAVATNDLSGNLFDTIISKMSLKNDAALARYLEVAPPVISKTRHGRLSVGPGLILNIHERTDWPIRDIKAMLPKAA